MSRTPDRVPGPSDEEETQYEVQTEDPTVEGAVRYVSGSFRLHDAIGVYNPRSTGLSIEYAIITTEGGIVYNSSGGIVIKETS